MRRMSWRQWVNMKNGMNMETTEISHIFDNEHAEYKGFDNGLF